jgi:hypothetical protein
MCTIQMHGGALPKFLVEAAAKYLTHIASLPWRAASMLYDGAALASAADKVARYSAARKEGREFELEEFTATEAHEYDKLVKRGQALC